MWSKNRKKKEKFRCRKFLEGKKKSKREVK